MQQVYKDPLNLFHGKKKILLKQITKDIKEYKSIKFWIGISIEVFHEQGDGKRNDIIGLNNGKQTAALNTHDVSDF